MTPLHNHVGTIKKNILLSRKPKLKNIILQETKIRKINLQAPKMEKQKLTKTKNIFKFFITELNVTFRLLNFIIFSF